MSLPLLFGDGPNSLQAARPAAVPASEAPAAVRQPGVLRRHPRGNREIALAGQSITYELKRARRRTIGFVIGTEGLAVSAPRWVGQAEIDAALNVKAAWILRKLVDQGERLQRIESARVDWRDGAQLPFLGGTLVVKLDPQVAGAVLQGAAEACAEPPSDPVGAVRRTLHIGLPTQAAPEQIRDAVQGWLQHQAMQLFEARCHHYAAQLGVQIKRLRLSSAQTRWGSASADGTVRLNWRLVHFGLASIDYVVAHELAHLREMNHSPAFWDVVRSVMPDFERRRISLKDGQVPVFD